MIGLGPRVGDILALGRDQEVGDIHVSCEVHDQDIGVQRNLYEGLLDHQERLKAHFNDLVQNRSAFVVLKVRVQDYDLRHECIGKLEIGHLEALGEDVFYPAADRVKHLVKLRPD